MDSVILQRNLWFQYTFVATEPVGFWIQQTNSLVLNYLDSVHKQYIYIIFAQNNQ